MEYLLHIGIMLCIYVILVLSTNLTVGMANLLTMCQAAFYGIGAYIGTYVLMQFNYSFLFTALVVLVVTGASSLIVSYASVKLKGDYFILGTLAFQMIVYTILYNWLSVTHGPYGIPGIPSIKLFGVWSLNNIYWYFLFSLVIAVLVVLIFSRLQHSPYGRMLRAIRNDELAVQALGRDTIRLKVSAFFISAAFAGLAGVVYASYMSYIDPTTFTLEESIQLAYLLAFEGKQPDPHRY